MLHSALVAVGGGRRASLLGASVALLALATPPAFAGDDPACPAPGDCFATHGTPGCEDAACCNAVCDVDAFCCAVQWDSLCADEAAGVCQPVCVESPCAGPPSCSTDLGGDGIVDGADLGALLGAWGTDPGACPDFNCDGTVDGADLGVLLGEWGTPGSVHGPCFPAPTPEPEGCGEDVNGGCNAPACLGASDCCTAHARAGCDDATCAAEVCANDQFCCESAWDAICTGLACALCETTCTPQAPPVTPIQCGEVVCGTAWALNGVRDTDWYELDLTGRDGNCRITATLTASFPATEVFIFDDACAPQTLGAAAGGCPAVATACVPPGRYRVVVAHGVFNGFPCGSQNDYLLEVDCDCAAPCDPPACGVPDAGDCCTPHLTPFCGDAACCEAVCAIVPFCCNVEWDVNCVFWSDNLCGVCQFPGACCLTDGSCVQTSGPMECGDLTGDFQGAGTTCGEVACPVTCGPGAGDCCADGGHFGPGCSDSECCDLVCKTDGFCCNFQWDASCAEEAEALCPICLHPGACCLKDGSCVDAGSAAECESLGGLFVGADTLCATTDCTPICGPGAGDCFEQHANPGCEEAACCFTVCGIDPYCCDVAWDSICVDEAKSFCISCGDSDAGPDCTGTDEGEGCGTDANGGCNSKPEIFGSIACGETVCGTAWADANSRDTDWYSFTVGGDGSQVVTVTLVAAFANANLLILDASCPPIAFATGEGNCVTTATACLPPGDYRVFVSQGVFDGFPCEGGAINYALTLECTGEPCSAEGCGAAGTGSCCGPHKTPFCDDAGCCDTICRGDPFCCEVEWDQECADAAGLLCEGCS